MIKMGKAQLQEEMGQLKTLVGLRTSVPKDQVYPKFNILAGTWKALVREREKNSMRKKLLVEVDFLMNRIVICIVSKTLLVFYFS